MKKEEHKLYKLTIHSEGKRFEFKLPTQKDCDKFFLSQIDLYTMRFDNKEDFLLSLKKQLNEANINNLEDAEILIEYKKNNKVKALKPVFSDKLYLARFATNAKTHVPLDASIFFHKKFTLKMGNGVLYRYIFDNNIIPNNVKDIFDNYFYKGKQEMEVQKKLSSYFQIRKILLSLEKCSFMPSKYALYHEYVDELKEISNMAIQSDFGDEHLENLYKKKDYEEIYNKYDIDKLDEMGALEHVSSSSLKK